MISQHLSAYDSWNLINLPGSFQFSSIFHQRGAAVGCWCDVRISKVLSNRHRRDQIEMACVSAAKKCYPKCFVIKKI